MSPLYYVHSSIERDGIVHVLARSEVDHIEPVFMSRFSDKHPSLYKYWGSPSSSSAAGIDRLIHLEKRKDPIWHSIGNGREKLSKIQPLCQLPIGLRVSDCADNYVDDHHPPIQCDHTKVSEGVTAFVFGEGAGPTESSQSTLHVAIDEIEPLNVSRFDQSCEFLLFSNICLIYSMCIYPP